MRLSTTAGTTRGMAARGAPSPRSRHNHPPRPAPHGLPPGITAGGWSGVARCTDRFRGPETLLPWLKEIREAVSCHVGALPLPMRTTAAEQPTFFNLSDPHASVPAPHGRAFPTALDQLYANRYEMGAFAKEAYDLGVNYLGVCCGAQPFHIREVAEAVGLTTEASRFSERIQNHFMYGDNERLPEHIVSLGNTA